MKRPKPASIARNLTYSLVLTVVAASTLIIGLNYFNASRKASIEMERNAQESIIYVTDILEIPMWNFNYQSIEQIGSSFFRNDLIVQLKIIDTSGKVLFHKEKDSNGTLIIRTGKVVYDGKPLGNVEISLTPRYYQKSNLQLLWSSIITATIILLILTIMTGVFLRVFLVKPLQRLSQVVNSYAAGSYGLPKDQVSVQEFRQFVSTLGRMGEKITAQMTELQKAEEKYRSIFVNAVEGIYQSSVDGRFISVNPAMARILRYESSDDLIGSIMDIATQLYVDPQQRKDFMQQIQKNKTVSGYEVQFYRKDQSKIWVTLDSRAVFNENGELLFFEGIVMDITDRKQMEMALQKAHEEMEFKIDERTRALKEKTVKLGRINKLFIDRELRMKELKQEIKILKPKLANGKTSNE